MKDKIIKIYYADQETGPAQYLSGRLARIIDTPVLAEALCRNAIVRLDRDPDKDEGISRIAEIVHSPYPCRSFLQFSANREAHFLLNLFSLLRADAQVTIEASDNKGGCLVVSHPDGLDAVALAEAIGISQQEEDQDEGG